MPQADVGRRYAAMPNVDAGLSPRHFLAAAPQLEERQVNVCKKPDSHRCQDIGFPDACCLNTEFCFVDSDFKAKCCAIGNDCSSINPCETSLYLCNSTTTLAASTTATHESGRAASNPSTTRHASSTSKLLTTPKPIVSTIQACCSRPCDVASSYQCPLSLGGRCCAFGKVCVMSGCVGSVPPTTSSTISTPSCAATTDLPCTDGLGGCCNPGEHCTISLSTGYCATGSEAPSALRTGGVLASGLVQTSPQSGLSGGAKAGIGAGVAIGALLVIGAGVWWWVARRRRTGEGGTPPRGSETVVSTQFDGSTPGARDMRGRGTEDYFGAAAAAGPFTSSDDGGYGRGAGRGAVPISPHEPGDIQPPVEIGEAMGRSAAVSPQATSPRREYWRNASTADNDPVELP